MTVRRGDSRHLSAVPVPGASAVPKPKPPPGNPYTRNPLLAYKIGADSGHRCSACRWVKAHLGWEFCPYHVAWRDMAEHEIVPVGTEGAFAEPASADPAFQRGDRVWFQGKLHVKIDVRYWSTKGAWYHIALGVSTDTVVNSAEACFTREFDAGWKA